MNVKILFSEAHPTDTGALHCCSRQLQEQVRDTILDFDPTLSRGEKLSVHRQKMLEKNKKIQEEKELTGFQVQQDKKGKENEKEDKGFFCEHY